MSQRICFQLHVRPDLLEEYTRRHAAVWPEMRAALTDAKAATETTVIVIETDPQVSVPSYESWWEVRPAEVSEQEGVRKARQDWSTNQKRQRHHI